MRPTLLLAALPLALAACQQAPTDTDAATDTAATVTETAPAAGEMGPGATPTVTETAAATPTASPTASPTSDGDGSTIPVALRGRWGLVAADCTSTRGDAKGLLTISPTTLKFYESLGTLGKIRTRTASTLRADFSFSGEGMTWTRDETLSVSGNKLTRTERGGDEPGSGGPFTYTRC